MSSLPEQIMPNLAALSCEHLETFLVLPGKQVEPARPLFIGFERFGYSHLYARRAPDPEHTDFSTAELQDLRNFYMKYHEYTLGTGELMHGMWIPCFKYKGEPLIELIQQVLR